MFLPPQTTSYRHANGSPWIWSIKDYIVWVDSGFIKLSYLSGALEKHEGREHRDAVINQKLFLKRTSYLEVGSLIFMNTAEIERHNATVCQNREIIKRIINGVIFLAKEEMAFRGHDERHSSSRMVIECFFGQLKSRFRCLLDGLKFRSMSTNCLVISSCVVLHNFILSNSSSDEQLFFW